MKPFKDCEKCIATKWCKIYSGEVDKGYKDWCSAKFRLDKALDLSNVPKAYRNANVSNMEREGMNKELKSVVDIYSKDILHEIDEGTNFLFYGSSPGTGKTYTAMVLLNQFIYKACLTSRFDFENPLGIFLTHADLMDDLRYRRNLDEVQEMLVKASTVPLLILDDIGSGTSSPFVRDQTYLIVNGRVNNGLSTIYTSNLPLSVLQNPESLGARTVSRIMGNCVGVEVVGVDKRRGTARGVVGK